MVRRLSYFPPCASDRLNKFNSTFKADEILFESPDSAGEESAKVADCGAMTGRVHFRLFHGAGAHRCSCKRRARHQSVACHCCTNLMELPQLGSCLQRVIDLQQVPSSNCFPKGLLTHNPIFHKSTSANKQVFHSIGSNYSTCLLFRRVMEQKECSRDNEAAMMKFPAGKVDGGVRWGERGKQMLHSG
jgi:hypothetical protein